MRLNVNTKKPETCGVSDEMGRDDANLIIQRLVD